MEQAGERQEYVWRDDNIVEIKYGNDEGETNVTRYTYYGELANKENFDVFYDRISWDEELAIAGVNGIPCRNLLHEERGESQWAYKDDFDMTYEVNGNGYILKLYRPNRNFPLPMKKMILGLGESNIFRENKHRKSQNYYEAIPYIFISSSCFGRLQQRRRRRYIYPAGTGTTHTKRLCRQRKHGRRLFVHD